MQPVVPKVKDRVALLADLPRAELNAGHFGVITQVLGVRPGTDREFYEVRFFADEEGRPLTYEKVDRSAFLVLVNVPNSMAGLD